VAALGYTYYLHVLYIERRYLREVESVVPIWVLGIEFGSVASPVRGPVLHAGQPHRLDVLVLTERVDNSEHSLK